MNEYSHDELIPIASKLVLDHFGLEDFSVKMEGDRMLAFESELKRVILYLLEKDFERLVRTMYRIDIDEEKVKYALSGLDEKDPADLIVEYVIDREMEKARTRLKYRDI